MYWTSTESEAGPQCYQRSPPSPSHDPRRRTRPARRPQAEFALPPLRDSPQYTCDRSPQKTVCNITPTHLLRSSVYRRSRGPLKPKLVSKRTNACSDNLSVRKSFHSVRRSYSRGHCAVLISGTEFGDHSYSGNVIASHVTRLSRL
ncbi:unnamed protein product [Leptosia nina]|uniref:Uncharacterized protein n=1 Tax=Leptosia nina TaxID=320188 RepID=A0AAV1JA05_9NEOP